jgi:hypothetical protein
MNWNTLTLFAPYPAAKLNAMPHILGVCEIWLQFHTGLATVDQTINVYKPLLGKSECHVFVGTMKKYLIP